MAADLGKLLGEGSAARQLLVWQVFGQLITAVLAPELELLTRAVNKVLPSTPLSAEQLADMVVRNIVDHAQAEAAAREVGVDGHDFERLVHSAGEPMALQQALEAYRRGLIPLRGTGPDSISVEQVIAESRMFTKYTDAAIGLSDVPLPVADAVDAVVENQISLERGQAEAYLSGVSAERFAILKNTRGNPPAVMELIELWRRGFIPFEGVGPDALSVRQGISEGATKDKWIDPIAHLADYVPPPRTVVAMLREGSITDAEGTALLQQSGLTPQLAAQYVASAHAQKLGPTKDLAKADVEALYLEGVINAAQATEMLQLLDFTAHDAAFILARVDAQRAKQAMDQAISRVHSLYVAHKITRQVVVTTLDALHVATAQRDQLLTTWDVERDVNLKEPSAASIVSAAFYRVITPDLALQLLQEQGYTPVGAWVELSVRFHGPQQPIPEGVEVPPNVP